MVAAARLDLAFFPAELDLAPHLRPGGHREASRLEVADEDARLLELHARGRDDLALDLTADEHGVRGHLTVDRRAGFDRELARDLHVALESTGNPDVPVAFDLSFDRETRGQNGLAALHRRRRRARDFHAPHG